jgi:hypothetical protein
MESGLRKNNVPRYLFRMWSSASGGHVSINTPTEIVPPAFNRKGSAPRFYSMPEDEARTMATNHYHGKRAPLTGFSSWAASLHLVLCYADYERSGDRDAHIAIMDTQDLEGEVLVWHVPHLLNGVGEHEYLAYGCIRGRGYKAVPYNALLGKNLKELFPEVKTISSMDHFGHKLRAQMFAKDAMPISDTEFEITRRIASLFGPLFLPIATAILTLRPRYSQDKHKIATRMRFFTSDTGSLINKAPNSWVSKFLIEEFDQGPNSVHSIMDGLRRPNMPPDLTSQAWLKRPDYINTYGFPDVQQWIILLYEISASIAVQDTKEYTVKTKEPKANQKVLKSSPIAYGKANKRLELHCLTSQ